MISWLKAATYSVAAFMKRHQTDSVDFPISTVGGKSLDPFFNVNTPEDLAKAEAIQRDDKP